jgi:hypothetical protein
MAAAGKQRLHLRGEAQRAPVIGEVERLDAVGVAGEEHALKARVPDREGVHAAQRVEHRGAAALPEMQQHLGVGLGAEHRALRRELVAQRTVVVDLAVEDDAEPAVGALHRLVGDGAQVDDRQPAMAEADAALGAHPLARAVRSARGHAVARGAQLRRVDRRCVGGVGEDAVDPAHGYLVSTARKFCVSTGCATAPVSTRR